MHAMFRRTAPGTTALLGATVAALAATVCVPAQARSEREEYPERPIRLLVGFAPGGGADTAARAIGQKLSESLGHQVVVDNRPGAAGNVAANIVAHASPDGHTLLMATTAALAINPALYGNLPFDPLRDFAPITRAVSATNVLLVHPEVRAYNVRELIELAKARPGHVRYGSSGVGGTGYLAGELFCSATRIRMTHVPYQRASAAMADLLDHQLQALFATAPSAIAHIRRGKVRALGVTTVNRAGMLPEVPTIAEQGVKGFDASNWYGLLAPAKTPRSIVERLNAEVVRVLAMPEVRAYLFERGLDPASTTPEAFAAYIKSEMLKWTRVVRAAGAAAG